MIWAGIFGRAEDFDGEVVEDVVSGAITGRDGAEGLRVAGNGFKVAAGERAGPGSLWAEALKIHQHFAHERKERADGVAAAKTDAHETVSGGFDKAESAAGDESCGGMIENFVGTFDGNTDAAESTADDFGDAAGLAITLNGEHNSVQFRCIFSTEGLKWMN